MVLAKKLKSFFTGKRELDMTQGSIIKDLMLFALPLLVGNLFQQLYNLVDTWVIGQTDNTGAYAAVGSVGPIINILIGFFSGLATGAGVVISQYYGAKDEDNVKKSVHTSVALTLILGVIFTVIGVLMTPWILKLMLHTSGDDNDIYVFAKQYLTIYFSGVIGLMIYNMGSGILRAVGDSQRPLYFLLVSATSNIILDLVFVFAFDMGAAGVAWATVISQCLSAILTVITLFRSKTWVKVCVKDIKVDLYLLGKIMKIGLPSALQMALTAFANVFVQSYISDTVGNQTANMGGWTTYSKLDQFIFLPIQSLAMAISTFVGQNLGAGNVNRAKKGAFTAFCMSEACTIVLIIPIMVFAPYLSAIFNKDAAIVDCATRLLRVITPFYLLCSVNQIFMSTLRGAGNSTAPMIIMLTSFVGVRQLYLYIMSNFISNELIPIGVSYPVGWFVCASLMLTYYLRYDLSKVKVVDKRKKQPA